MIFFASKLTRQAHRDLETLISQVPTIESLFGGATRYGNDVFNVTGHAASQPGEPAPEPEFEFNERTGADELAPNFVHYPTGARIWLGSTPSGTRHNLTSAAQWESILAECLRSFQAQKAA